ncbi:MAG: hypothetical protein R2693_05055 [Nocardioidaceae bacterium]
MSSSAQRRCSARARWHDHERRFQDRVQTSGRYRRHGLPGRLPATDPSNRGDQPQRPQQHLTRPNDLRFTWAIGSRPRHDAVHPDLGTLSDFDDFVAKANALGLEVALDFALQAAPDHPWVKEHPEWFTTLPDGSIAYAENPPKKYQDIYPLNFDNDPEGLYSE